MAGWTPEKVALFRDSFFSFLKVVRINSKEMGPIVLGDHIYRAQHRFFDFIFDGLGRDIHDFKHLKSRQLGVSTASRALTVFWCGIHSGLRGYMVFDTDSHKEEARLELLEMINGLPANYKFPRIRYNNRYLIELENDTRINLAAAGARVTKTTNTLGRSSGINFVHASEICSWADFEAVEAFKAALAQDFENRLYIWESTGKGYNIWRDIWLEAKADSDHQCSLFTGWWGKDNQIIRRSDPDFERYGVQPPSDDELRKIAIVRENYGWEITPEQLAWVRRYMNPGRSTEGGMDVEYDGEPSRIQEVPWHEEEAFQVTGTVFFAPEKLSDQMSKNVSKKFTSWRYEPGLEFHEMKVYPAPNTRSIELKVWEEPVDDSIYIIAIDPAFGHSDTSDRSAIQVVRAFADGLDQVAEYAWPLITTNHLAWVAASLAAWYGASRSEVYLMIELNGPGDAVWTEIKQLRHRLEVGQQPKEVEEAGLRDIFRNVKNYFYWRTDSLGPGRALHWKCLALDTPIPTVDGWKMMGDIEENDRLLDERGEPCNVAGAFPAISGHECFRLSFDDRTSIVCDAEHLWEVNGGMLIATEDMFTLGGKYQIDLAKPLDLLPSKLPVDPYVLGVWLGDGNSDSGTIWSHEDDTGELRDSIARAGYSIGTIKQYASKAQRFGVLGLHEQLREIGVLNDKHIPSQYLRGSFVQRLSLLQGLMDTDGYINPNNGLQCDFTTASAKLSSGFAELVRTLGIKAKKLERKRTIRSNGEDVVCFADQFYFSLPPGVAVFRLKRKAEHVREKWVSRRSGYHRIEKIEKMGSVPVRCIEVDSPSSLFLAGDGMIPTHNTQANNKVGLMERLRDFISNGMLRVRSAATIEEMMSVSREKDTIEAQGRKKDDRVIALALAVRMWEDRVRRMMVTQKRSRDNEAAKRRMSPVDRFKVFSTYQIDELMARKSRGRMIERRAQSRATWRSR